MKNFHFSKLHFYQDKNVIKLHFYQDKDVIKIHFYQDKFVYFNIFLYLCSAKILRL